MPRHWETTKPFFLSPLPAAASRCCSLPAGCFPCRRLLRFPLPMVFHGAPARQHPHPTPALRPAPRPAASSSAPRLLLPIGAMAGNKPHPAEKSTPVWLAIWRIWAGFANSQLLRATFRSTYLYMCLSTLLPHWAAAQTDANLSAHLHRLPTPPPYLRRMRLSPGRVQVLDAVICNILMAVFSQS